MQSHFKANDFKANDNPEPITLNLRRFLCGALQRYGKCDRDGNLETDVRMWHTNHKKEFIALIMSLDDYDMDLSNAAVLGRLSKYLTSGTEKDKTAYLLALEIDLLTNYAKRMQTIVDEYIDYYREE